MFIHLHNSRSSNGFGVNPIPYSEIESYCRLMNDELEDWEIRLIKEMDNIALAQYAKESERQSKKAKAKK